VEKGEKNWGSSEYILGSSLVLLPCFFQAKRSVKALLDILVLLFDREEREEKNKRRTQ